MYIKLEWSKHVLQISTRVITLHKAHQEMIKFFGVDDLLFSLSETKMEVALVSPMEIG